MFTPSILRKYKRCVHTMSRILIECDPFMVRLSNTVSTLLLFRSITSVPNSLQLLKAEILASRHWVDNRGLLHAFTIVSLHQ